MIIGCDIENKVKCQKQQLNQTYRHSLTAVAAYVRTKLGWLIQKDEKCEKGKISQQGKKANRT